MYEFFELLLQMKGITAADVCKATGIGQPTISTWKARNNVLNAKLLYDLSIFFDVPMEFFLTGRTNKKEFPQKNDFLLSPDEKNLISNFRLLDDMARNMIYASIDSALASAKKSVRIEA